MEGPRRWPPSRPREPDCGVGLKAAAHGHKIAGRDELSLRLVRCLKGRHPLHPLRGRDAALRDLLEETSEEQQQKVVII